MSGVLKTGKKKKKKLTLSFYNSIFKNIEKLIAMGRKHTTVLRIISEIWKRNEDSQLCVIYVVLHNMIQLRIAQRVSM